MVSFRIITDSTADFPPEWDIPFVPVHVYAGIVDMKDKVDFTVDTLLDITRKGIRARTAAPSVKEWMRAFESLGNDLPILAITISSKLSGTFKSAEIAAKMLAKKGFEVHVLDSLTGSIGAGILVARAKEMAEKGVPIGDALQKLRALVNRVRIYLVVADMEAAARSGRLPNVVGKIGKFLRLNPIFVVKDGVFHLWKTVRGQERVVQEFADLIRGKKEVWAGVLGRNEYADRMASEIRENCERVVVCSVDPAIGARLGYGSFGVAFLE
ncbi:MAG: fatty acid kinase fatty acid binding subunit [Candidatus Diapherotrites archaeon]|nr:fatty acid kinase fatty acid binding subunit [Candidatus Diapherotrites archaeon]MDN5366786.1 fatty acid kinase fatty acid binding subunit [Candidatus Diapherotrites archaeon]